MASCSSWSVNSHPEEHALWEARVGVEAEPGCGAQWQPFLSADLHLEQGTRRDPRLAVQAGIWLARVEGRALRLAIQGLTGPSPMGQFRERRARSVGLGLFWYP